MLSVLMSLSKAKPNTRVMNQLNLEIHLVENERMELVFQVFTYCEKAKGYFDTIGNSFETLAQAFQYVSQLTLGRSAESVNIKIFQ